MKRHFQNKDTVISSLISRNEYYANQAYVLLRIPLEVIAILTSFISGKNLSNHQAEELKD